MIIERHSFRDNRYVASRFDVPAKRPQRVGWEHGYPAWMLIVERYQIAFYTGRATSGLSANGHWQLVQRAGGGELTHTIPIPEDRTLPEELMPGEDMTLSDYLVMRRMWEQFLKRWKRRLK